MKHKIRLKEKLNLPDGLSEHALLELFRKYANKNKVFKSYIGTGYYGTFTPTVILRNVLENYRLIGEQGCGHAGQRGVFGAADANSAEERLASANDEFIHRSSVIVKRGERRVT